ncbi:MAG: hypothetical protein IKC87_04265 [Clostridia bacterium]|nr:hypothetical protein [Clostridia bacterium]
MAKIALVINGRGGVGKDTLCDLAAKHYKVYNISSVDPIKEIARMCGWDGRKDDKSRRFLSDIKALTVAYNDFPTVWAKERYLGFLGSENEIMFLHIREPLEIEKFVRATGGEAKTLLIRGGGRMTKESYGNVSDDNVENYSYDYYFTNDKSLEEAEKDFCELLASMMK